MKLELERFAYCPWGTYGVLQGFEFQAWTVERPWLSNKPWVSCIPEGHYRISLHFSPRHKQCVKIHDVPGRSNILIHKANVPTDLYGCIGVGFTEQFTYANQWGVGRSAEAMQSLIDALERDGDAQNQVHIPVHHLNISRKLWSHSFFKAPRWMPGTPRPQDYA